jgi:hypothetical protein
MRAQSARGCLCTLGDGETGATTQHPEISGEQPALFHGNVPILIGRVDHLLEFTGFFPHV